MGDAADVERPANWEWESHCRGVEPNYEKLFDDSVVHRFDIAMSPAYYQVTLADLDAKLSGGGPGEDPDGLPQPVWVPANVTYDGRTWQQVGFRWKGHSSLRAAFQAGIRKLAFRLNFDKFEDLYPDLRNQRFYGFKKLTFSNAYKDPSLMRDKLAGDIFRRGGVPAPRSAFAAIYLDYGEGPVYLGLYAMLEDPSNRMLDSQFLDDRGHLYKPWGEPATWISLEELDEIGAETGRDGESMIKAFFKRSDINYQSFLQLNESDFGDVVATLHALHGDRDMPELWRSKLEEVFNVQRFLRWLAINQVMVNWDTYGCMHHNYYVYADPTDNWRLTWFPWDLNEAMRMHTAPGCPAPGSVMLDEIVYADPNDQTNEIDWNWPLIRYILGDAAYRETYRNEVIAALGGAFALEWVHQRMDHYHALISPYVVGPMATEVFPYTNLNAPLDFVNALTQGVDALKPHAAARHVAVREELGI